MSMDEYEKTMEMVEDLEDIKIAKERLKDLELEDFDEVKRELSVSD